MITRGELISLTEARAMIERRTGRALGRGTLGLWCTTGCRGFVLPVRWIGGRRFTTERAVERFLEAINSESGCEMAALR